MEIGGSAEGGRKEIGKAFWTKKGFESVPRPSQVQGASRERSGKKKSALRGSERPRRVSEWHGRGEVRRSGLLSRARVS